jgi:hypothetical protein
MDYSGAGIVHILSVVYAAWSGKCKGAREGNVRLVCPVTLEGWGSYPFISRRRGETRESGHNGWARSANPQVDRDQVRPKGPTVTSMRVNFRSFAPCSSHSWIAVSAQYEGSGRAPGCWVVSFRNMLPSPLRAIAHSRFTATPTPKNYLRALQNETFDRLGCSAFS